MKVKDHVGAGGERKEGGSGFMVNEFRISEKEGNRDEAREPRQGVADEGKLTSPAGRNRKGRLRNGKVGSCGVLIRQGLQKTSAGSPNYRKEREGHRSDYDKGK